MDQTFCEVENTDPAQHQKWLDKHGFKPAEDGTFPVDGFEGKLPVDQDKLYDYIRENVANGDYVSMYGAEYDERTFVMICGGPSLANHLDEIREKTKDEANYMVVCSNMTADYLRSQGITPHVHFVIDPQEKKKFDVANAIPEIEYWINAACHPEVFKTLKERGIRPGIFLADFEAEGKAQKAVKDSLPPTQPGMMAIQGGTMAGLRALNLADAMGFRKFEYYGFDACVEVKDGKARPYAYEKKRGEAIIEVACDRCDAKFDTTLVFQKQVNEFIQWRSNLRWIDINIIGEGLVAHYLKHIEDKEAEIVSARYRFTEEYKRLQHDLHSKGNYGTSGVEFVPTLFHGIAQLHKKFGAVTVLDYGSAGGKTVPAVRDKLFLPPNVTDACYDPFVEEYSQEPEPADFVVCTDVMEHVEPECTEAVLDHLQRLTKKLIFLSISLIPANKTLADGRNAHINLRTAEYWLKQIKRRFITSEVKVFRDDTLLIIAQSIDAVREELRKNGRRVPVRI